MNTVTLSGLNDVMNNLKKEIDLIEGRTLAGLIQGAIIVRRDMEKTSPKTPLDLGNLRASFFTVTTKGVDAGSTPDFKGSQAATLQSTHVTTLSSLGTALTKSKNPIVVFGFSANYAVWVHENIGAKFKRPGTGAKFLEAAVSRNTNEILKVITESAKIQ